MSPGVLVGLEAGLGEEGVVGAGASSGEGLGSDPNLPNVGAAGEGSALSDETVGELPAAGAGAVAVPPALLLSGVLRVLGAMPSPLPLNAIPLNALPPLELAEGALAEPLRAPVLSTGPEAAFVELRVAGPGALL